MGIVSPTRSPGLRRKERRPEPMSALPDKILLATDGSEDAALAARIAADLSTRAGSELHVIHVLEPLPRFAYPGVTPDVYSYVLDEQREEGHKLLDEQVERITESGAKVHRAHLVAGPPVDGILDVAEEIDADLIVVGSRGLGPIKRLALGSISEGVVHHASRPVLVARGGERAWPPRRIVVGDDGSEDAQRAGELVASMSKLFGAKVILVRAHPPFRSKVSREGRSSQLQAFYDALLEDEKDLKRRAGELEDVLGSRPPAAVVQGDAATTIVGAAEHDREPTLVVVGSRGLGPIRRLRLGSVSTKVVRAAGEPVLVYSHPRE